MKRHYPSSNPESLKPIEIKESVLKSHLVQFLREHINYKEALSVLGLLSFRIDNLDEERFIKIDFTCREDGKQTRVCCPSLQDTDDYESCDEVDDELDTNNENHCVSHFNGEKYVVSSQSTMPDLRECDSSCDVETYRDPLKSEPLTVVLSSTNNSEDSTGPCLNHSLECSDRDITGEPCSKKSRRKPCNPQKQEICSSPMLATTTLPDANADANPPNTSVVYQDSNVAPEMPSQLNNMQSINLGNNRQGFIIINPSGFSNNGNMPSLPLQQTSNTALLQAIVNASNNSMQANPNNFSLEQNNATQPVLSSFTNSSMLSTAANTVNLGNALSANANSNNILLAALQQACNSSTSNNLTQSFQVNSGNSSGTSTLGNLNLVKNSSGGFSLLVSNPPQQFLTTVPQTQSTSLCVGAPVVSMALQMPDSNQVAVNADMAHVPKVEQCPPTLDNTNNLEGESQPSHLENVCKQEDNIDAKPLNVPTSRASQNNSTRTTASRICASYQTISSHAVQSSGLLKRPLLPSDSASGCTSKTAGESSTNTALNPSGEREFRCRYCSKVFNRKFCRERHERLHTGVRPYTCDKCDETFIRLEDKKRHSLAQHMEEVDETAMSE